MARAGAVTVSMYPSRYLRVSFQYLSATSLCYLWLSLWNAITGPLKLNQAIRWGQNDMSQPDLRVTPLDDLGDDRGSSFSVPDSWIAFLGSAHDLHLTTLRPGGVRGNHFHIVRREILVISYRDAWTLHWDRGESTPQESLRFEGVGAVLVEVDPYAAHAIVNEGIDDLLIVGITNGSFDPDSPDSVRRLLV